MENLAGILAAWPWQRYGESPGGMVVVICW